MSGEQKQCMAPATIFGASVLGQILRQGLCDLSLTSSLEIRIIHPMLALRGYSSEWEMACGSEGPGHLTLEASPVLSQETLQGTGPVPPVVLA